MKHSPIGASSAERWFNCPGSVRLNSQIPEPPISSYAFEGICAHVLVHECIERDTHPMSLIGMTMKEPESGISFQITENMALATTVFFKELNLHVAFAVVYDLYLEKYKTPQITKISELSLDMSWLYPDLYGTVDYVKSISDEELTIYDYKHGQGVAVPVTNNKQLLYYAVGTRHYLKTNPKKMTLVIVQPRFRNPEMHIQRWTITKEELDKFEEELVKAARRTEDPEAPLVAGNHCRFCKAKAICPEVKKKAQKIIREDSQKDPVDLSGKDIQEALDNEVLIISWFKAVKEYSLTKVKEDTSFKIPGYELSEKLGRLKWNEIKEVKEYLKDEAGLSKEEMYSKQNLKTPNQLFKLLDADHRDNLKKFLAPIERNSILVKEDKELEELLAIKYKD